MTVSPFEFSESRKNELLQIYLKDCERLHVIREIGGRSVYDRVRVVIAATYDVCIALSKKDEDYGAKKWRPGRSNRNSS